MPKNFMKYKAGKITFLLVCLFLCTACGKQKAVFEAGVNSSYEPEAVKLQETPAESEDTSVKTETLSKETENVSDSPCVNINTAAAEELMTLPGIGEVRAEAIIEYRNRVGRFEKIEDIMNVKGIKTGVFSKINDLICVK